ncbi:MAG: hypothetical protein ACOY94_25955 [Bacillota bacterium]
MSSFGQGPSDPILKPRDLGQLLDQSFKVFGRSWKPLIAIGLVAAIPSVIAGLMTLTMFPSLNSPDPMNNWFMRMFIAAERGDFSGVIAFFSVMGVMMIAFLLLVPLYMGALIDVSARAVLYMEPVPLMESLRVGARRYWSLLGTYLLKGLIWIVALPVMVLAGLVIFSFITVPLGSLSLLVVMVFANHAIIIEGRGGGMDALKRAYELGRSRFWPLMGIGIVFYLLVYFVQMIIVMPFSFGTMIAVAFTESTALMGLQYVIQGATTAVAYPFLVMAQTLVYFDTRIRREGYDLEVMARQQQAQEQEPQPVFTPPSPPEDPQR